MELFLSRRSNGTAADDVSKKSIEAVYWEYLQSARQLPKKLANARQETENFIFFKCGGEGS